MAPTQTVDRSAVLSPPAGECTCITHKPGLRRGTVWPADATMLLTAANATHPGINICMGSAGVYRWEFDKGSQSLTVGVKGPLMIDDMDMTIRAAVDSIGLAVSLEEYVAPHLASRALVRVLEDWCPPFARFLTYYPSGGSNRHHCRR